MGNVYDELYRLPSLESWEFSPEKERLATQLVFSGRLRIDTEEKCNFVRFSRPEQGIFLIFSHREIFDPNLIERTKAIIKSYIRKFYRSSLLDKEADKIIAVTRKSSKLNIDVEHSLEQKIARLVIQATHPSVIMLILLENTEVFVSFSHNVGGMLDIPSWREVGNSGGLQRTDGMGSSVFVSCGSDPFFSYEEDKKEVKKKGFNDSLSRMLVIAAQELGHYADIIRNSEGFKVSRHSSDLWGQKAKKHIKEGRQKDVIRSLAVKQILNDWDIKTIIRLERHMQFYITHKRKAMVVRNTKSSLNWKTYVFFRNVKKYKLDFLLEFKKHKTPCTQICKMVKDMLDNLTPEADAYKRDTIEETEAIACVEALARIPQQEVKWGPGVTKTMMPNLYNVYYNKVIPSCIKTVEIFSGKKYNFIAKKPNFIKKIFMSKISIVKQFFIDRKQKKAQKKEDKLNQRLGIKILKSRKYY